jgi:hypothetical protein
MEESCDVARKESSGVDFLWNCGSPSKKIILNWTEYKKNNKKFQILVV